MSRPPGSTREWQAIARGDDVLYHVLTWPEKRGAWTEEDFYATGVSDWEDFRRHWRHHSPELGGTCVEIGCGAGRVTRALAADFERVVALDVSPELIERARAVSPAGVEYREVAGPEIPLADGEADAVFSVHVLQHLDSFDDVAAYLGEARRVLRPGGSLMVHITLSGGRPGPLRRALDELRLWRSRRALRRGEEHFSVRMRLYPAEDVHRLLDRLGFVDVELRRFPVRSNGYHHDFWLARAPS